MSDHTPNQETDALLQIAKMVSDAHETAHEKAGEILAIVARQLRDNPKQNDFALKA